MHYPRLKKGNEQNDRDANEGEARDLIADEGHVDNRKPRDSCHTLPFYTLAFSLTFSLTFISLLDRDSEDRENRSHINEEMSPSLTRRSGGSSMGYASRRVQRTITYGLMKHGTFEEANLNGGTGVLVNGLGAYWVQNGAVYALNGLAKSYSKGIGYGPAGLSQRDLLEALGK